MLINNGIQLKIEADLNVTNTKMPFALDVAYL